MRTGRALRSSSVTDDGRADQRRARPCRSAAAPTKVAIPSCFRQFGPSRAGGAADVSGNWRGRGSTLTCGPAAFVNASASRLHPFQAKDTATTENRVHGTDSQRSVQRSSSTSRSGSAGGKIDRRTIFRVREAVVVGNSDHGPGGKPSRKDHFWTYVSFPFHRWGPSRPDPSPVPGFGRKRKLNIKWPTLDSLLKVGGKALKVRRSNLYQKISPVNLPEFEPRTG